MLAVVSNADADQHDTGPRHPERPARTRVALDGLVEAHLSDAIAPLSPRPATMDELVLVHDRSYLDRLEMVCQTGGGVVDTVAPTFVSPGSWATALDAAGAGLVAIAAIDGGDAEAGLVLTRPPGHHAPADEAMGFCLLNNVAVSAAHLAARGERVLILDWDVHHGNGTQSIFWNDPRVLFVSTHQRGLCPNTGHVAEVGGPDAVGRTINIPLPPGTTCDVLARALDEIVGPAVESSAPTWVLVSAGFDGHRADPLADFSLSAADFADAASRSRAFGSRVVLFLEGGYDLDALRASVGAAAAATLGQRYRPEPATAGGPGQSWLDQWGPRWEAACEAESV